VSDHFLHPYETAGRGHTRVSVVWLIAAAVLVSCGPDEVDADGAVADVADADDTGPACHPASERSDGSCCYPGTFYAADLGKCLAIGPPECAGVLPHAAGNCMPRWCADLLDEEGASCKADADGCLPVGRLCGANELAAKASCAVGWWPDPTGQGACSPAGLPGQWRQGAGGPGGLDSLPPLVAPAGVPPLDPLPALLATRFCHDKDAYVGDGTRICDSGENGCGPGTLSDPADPDACIPVGVPWACPPGFVVDEDVPVPVGELATCKPDPADCGAGPWPPAPPGAPAHHVLASAPMGGDGSAGKPFRNLVEALAAAKAGDAILLAAGTYAGGVSIDRPLAIIGRCAAKVTIQSALGGPAFYVAGGQATAQARIANLRIRAKAGGIRVEGPLRLDLQRVQVFDSAAFGLFAWGKKAHAKASGLLVANIVAGGTLPGFGIVAGGGARIEVADARVRRSSAVGLLVQHVGSLALAARLLIDDTRADAKKFLGVGARVRTGARLELRSARVRASLAAGVLAMEDKTTLRATGLLVDDTAGQLADGNSGYGLGLLGPVSATLRGVRLHRNRSFGLFTPNASTGGRPGQGATLDAQGLVIDGTLPRASDGVSGFGMGIFIDARATLNSVRLSGNRGAGLAVVDAGATLQASGLLVDGTLAEVDTEIGGHGIDVLKGGRVALDAARFSGNRVNAIYLNHPGSYLSARRLLVDDTLAGTPSVDAKGQPGTPGHAGVGIAVIGGARATVMGGRVTRSRTVGVMAVGLGARLRATGLLIDDTLPNDAASFYGVGAAVFYSASLQLNGSRVVASRQVGVAAFSGGLLFRGVGLSVEGTKGGQLEGEFGAGGWFEGTSMVELLASRLVGNRSAAVAFEQATGRIENSVVADTAPAKYDNPKKNTGSGDEQYEMADGLLMQDGAKVQIRRCLALRLPRAGLYVRSSPNVKISQTLAMNCGFGLALIESPGVQLTGNLMHDNDRNRASDGLQVPEAPDLATW